MVEAKERWRMVRRSRVKPREKRANATDRVAVVLCGCGGEIAEQIDLEDVAKRLKSHDVALVRIADFPCDAVEIGKIGAAMARARTGRVVIAGCSERLFGRHFRTHLGAAGVGPAFIEFADIKDHAALPHRGAKAAATAKAARLVAAAVARVRRARPPERIATKIIPLCAVIGGGVAGISAAVGLATRGVKVVLIEKGERVGGLIRKLNVVYPNHVASKEFVVAKSEDLAKSGATLIAGAAPVAVRGHVGNFEIDLSNGQKIGAGAIIVATGADLLVPNGLFGYGTNPRVITQMDLEGILIRSENPGARIVMIQCAGSRNAERPYCSRVCCTASIVNTIVLKQKFPDARITVLSRGFAEYAGDLDRARQMGVEIIRYRPERPPVVGENTVDVYDEILEMETHLPYDRVVLAVPIVPSDATRELAAMLRLPTDRFGFLIEPHLKVRPEEFAPRGIFVAGCAHWPATITESIVQAYTAASRAFDLIKAGEVARETVAASVDKDLCRGCSRCLEVCRHGAIEVVTAEDGLKRASVIPVQCTGCGVCVSICPSGALTLGSSEAESVGAVVDAMMEAED